MLAVVVLLVGEVDGMSLVVVAVALGGRGHGTGIVVVDVEVVLVPDDDGGVVGGARGDVSMVVTLDI